MESADRRHFLDKRRARIIAGLIGLAALMAMAQVWNVHMQMTQRTAASLASSGLEAAPAVNPEFIACRDRRVADVDRMLADGVIDAGRHAEYKERAIQTCAGQFPPDRGG